MEETEQTFQHIMLDIETMGSESFSSILSIGALEFDIETGKTGKEFYVNVDLQSCIDLGLNVDASAIMWWLQQTDEARKSLTERKGLSITEALKEFSKFCSKDYEIWGNSPRFDCGILQNAYNKANMDIPWDFRKERCVRTLVSFNPELKKKYINDGIAHNAISDCYYQVGYCSNIWESKNIKKLISNYKIKFPKKEIYFTIEDGKLIIVTPDYGGMENKKAKNREEAWDLQETYNDKPHGWIQWKGTDVCMDIHCKCGELTHVDAEFAYNVKCGNCGTIYMCNGHIELIELETIDENSQIVISE